MTAKPWTDEETDRLFEMVKAGKTFREIGLAIGRQRLACLGRYHRVLVSRGHIPSPRKRVLDGIAAELSRNTTPKRTYNRVIPEPQVAAGGVGFIMPAIPAPKPRRGRAIGILDVTGCRWPVDDDARLAGGKAFCNAPQMPGRSYCPHHAAASRSVEGVKTWLKRAMA